MKLFMIMMMMMMMMMKLAEYDLLYPTTASKSHLLFKLLSQKLICDQHALVVVAHSYSTRENFCSCVGFFHMFLNLFHLTVIIFF